MHRSGAVLASVYHRHHEPNSGANVVDAFLRPRAPAGTYLLRLRGERVADGRAQAWIERAGPPGQSRFPAAVAAATSTTGSICNGSLPLAVGAYDAHDPERRPARFSSAGPTRDGRGKPDLAAPGVRVVAARSSVPAAADGGRDGNGTVAKSGTSMAAPHVTGAVALVFESVAPRLLPMALTRWVLLESARRDPPASAVDALRYGAGRVDARAACELARALLVPVPTPGRAPTAATAGATTGRSGGSTMTTAHAAPETVLGWLTGEGRPEGPVEPGGPAGPGGGDAAEAVVGRLALPPGSVLVDARPPASTHADLDAAVRAALARPAAHSVITATTTATTTAVTTATGGSPSYRVEGFGPPAVLPVPPVVDFDGNPDVLVLCVNGGDQVWLPADPAAPGRRWVAVPGLRSAYGVAPADATRLRNASADRLAAAVPTISRAAARATGLPLLRVTLAAHGAAAFPVSTVHRGTPPVDTGGVVNGVTLPVVQLPLREPHCYLPVISEVEGRLESINAWDAEAGVSLGTIQFNAHRGALFRFLWLLWTRDRDLFSQALTGPLHWTMALHGDHPDLLVARGGGTDTLHGRAADTALNARYLERGVPGAAPRDPGYRRGVAAALRDCVVWPHVQEMVVDVSAWWLEDALATVRAEGVGPLDPARPDRDTFVLTAVLLSAAVRFSGCLHPLLLQLRRWSSTGDKLAHWEEALRATAGRCPELVPRLRLQVGHARHVHDQVRRLVAAAGAVPAEDDGPGTAEVLDTAVAAPTPTTPVTGVARALTPAASRVAQEWNGARHPAVSGVTGADVVARVALHVDLAAAARTAAAAGATGGTPPFDAGCVEAVHQFQAGAFVEPGQADGKLGPSTLDTLGLVRRNGTNPVAVPNTTAQAHIDGVATRLRATSGGEFTARTWWEGMVNPGWLGQRFSNGIHLVLARRLRQAEALLLAQPALAGSNGVQLGAALGITEGHKGARPTAGSASMHTYGLAVDVEYTANPWIVGQHVDGGRSDPSPVGEVTREANRTMTRVLNRASLLVHGEVVDVTGRYLHRLSAGTAGAAWDDLHRRHTALRDYLALAGDVPAARALVVAHRTVAGVVLAGEGDDGAARRWAAGATADLAALRLGPVTRRNARGREESVDRSNFSGRDPLLGILSLSRDLVVALRDGAGLAWGAIDFGEAESGDLMHFDCRRDGVGALLRGA